jgi:SAM-dependent methyltransferase
MFFQNKIVSINSTDKVLEIGPGATPYFRSDVLLEKKYETEKELIAQSGNIGVLKTDKSVIYYDGDRFPFADKEFDYVICSHVLEHVPNADVFLKEIQRVGKKGYLEFPTLYYDYLYNIPEHTLLLLEKDACIKWMTKKESGLSNMSPFNDFFIERLSWTIMILLEILSPIFFRDLNGSTLYNRKRLIRLKSLPTLLVILNWKRIQNQIIIPTMPIFHLSSI